ncbi:methyltransferase domain-containing protein [Prescottella defluvii]|nr:methyltransferase domain-containing protein [Prescottella defluvii]
MSCPSSRRSPPRQRRKHFGPIHSVGRSTPCSSPRWTDTWITCCGRTNNPCSTAFPHGRRVGSRCGANLRYLRAGTRLIAVEPNRAMHDRLRSRAARAHIDLELHTTGAERLDLPDDSVDAVISSLVLCTVTDPGAVLTEVHRILRPGGRYAFLEHVAAPDGTALRRLQRATRRPWSWTFEGCSCERDLRADIEAAGFAETTVEAYRLRSPFLQVNTQIAGVARKGG